MHIDKYKDKDGYYTKGGCEYEKEEDFILTELLGFCGCGKPNDVLEHLCEALQLIDDLKQLVWEKKLTYEEWTERKKEVFVNSGAEYFMWYVLDNKELIEHGSSVPGWLTQEGIELLSDLKELYHKE